MDQSDGQRVLLSGNEAVALGAWRAGCRFAAAYPGTPSSEILPAFVQICRQRGTQAYAEWSVNEKVALEAAAGAAMAGARAMAAMKHVGLNVAADPLFTLAETGTEAGLVVVSCDDPGMHSSQNEQDNRFYARHAGLLLLEPSDSQEACDFAALAFEISERFDLPVLLRLTTRVSHSRTPVAADVQREERPASELRPNPEKYVMVPANARRRRLRQLEALEAARQWAEEAPINRVLDGRGEVGFISAGVAFQYLRELLPQAPVLKLGMTWPLPRRMLQEFCRRFARVIVVEELEPFLAEQIRALGLSIEPLPERFHFGELTPGRLAQALREMGVEVPGKFAEPDGGGLPARPPVLCPGCPHRPVFAVLRKLGVYVTGDIGCYTLAYAPPLRALHTCLCMGGGVSQAHGMSKATGTKPVAAIGDSTFTHAGLPALLNAIYNGGELVVLILDNKTTAMTGGQDHPATGRTLMGDAAPKLDFVQVAQAMGASMAERVDAFDMAAVEAALRRALQAPGVAVVVAEGECVLLRRRRGRAMRIDRELCTACGLCLRLACPAIGCRVEAGRRWPEIDELLCNGCGVCAQICPQGAIGEVQDEG